MALEMNTEFVKVTIEFGDRKRGFRFEEINEEIAEICGHMVTDAILFDLAVEKFDIKLEEENND